MKQAEQISPILLPNLTAPACPILTHIVLLYFPGNNHSESLAYILTQLKTVSGAQEVKYKKPSNSKLGPCITAEKLL